MAASGMVGVCLTVMLINVSVGFSEDINIVGPNSFVIEGKVSLGQYSVVGQPDLLHTAVIHVDNGAYIAIPNNEGRFVISGVPTGSYVVEVSHPTYVFEPFRVDISSKGKIRARKVNFVQPGKVDTVEYPLSFKAHGKAPYFQKREEWRITDMLMNPMVLMMVLPMALIFILPKMMNAADPETQKEMQSSMNMFKTPNQQMPDLAETLTSWLGGGASQQKPKRKNPVR